MKDTGDVKMKISIINGSPRKNGATGTILKESEHYLKKKYDADIEYIDLAKTGMKFCKGCLVCYQTGKCTIEEDGIEEISSKIKKSDGIIIGSPTYGSNVSGLLKNFMDRGHFILEQSLRNAYGFTVTTHELAEGKKTQEIIEKFFLVSGASRRGKMLVKLGFNTDPFTNTKLKNDLHRKLDKFAEDITQRKSKSIYEHIFNWIQIKAIMKPHFLKHSQKYAGVLKIWKENGII